MLSGLSELGQAYLSILNVYSLTYGLSGALLGIIVGCLPGLSATLCIALLTTLTIKMAPNDAILILICSYVGTLYGVSRTAILLNIPGTAANAASCADGHARPARRSRRAIGLRHRARSAARCSACCNLWHLRRCSPKSRCRSGRMNSSGSHCSGLRCPAASSATIR
jgi:TctA family transporter